MTAKKSSTKSDIRCRYWLKHKCTAKGKIVHKTSVFSTVQGIHTCKEDHSLKYQALLMKRDLKDQISMGTEVQEAYDTVKEKYTKVQEILPFKKVCSNLYKRKKKVPNVEWRCGICFGPKTPIGLNVPCGHTFCLPCSQGEVTRGKCSICKTKLTGCTQVFNVPNPYE